jgi:hypothetical protein
MWHKMKAKNNRNLPREQKGGPASTEYPGMRSVSTIWTPEEFAAHLSEAPLEANQGIVDSAGVVVEHRRKPPQELFAPGMTHHLLGLLLMPSAYFWQHIGEEIHEGLRVPGSTTVVPAVQPYYACWDGAALSVEYTSAPIRDEEDHIVGAVVTFQDITARKDEKEQ